MFRAQQVIAPLRLSCYNLSLSLGSFVGRPFAVDMRSRVKLDDCNCCCRNFHNYCDDLEAADVEVNSDDDRKDEVELPMMFDRNLHSPLDRRRRAVWSMDAA